MHNITKQCKNIFHLTFLVSVILYSISFPALGENRKYKIEAAYLYSFFNYITWPGYNAPQELPEPVICVYGEDPILSYLEYVRIKMSTEREFTVRSVIEETETIGCHIFFIRHSIPSSILASLPKSTLTVLKPDDPLDRGGMVELSEDGERIAIKINHSQLEQKDFHVSSRLLDLARR